MAAPAFVGQTGESDTTASVSIPAPTGLQAGDHQLIVVLSGTSGTPPTISNFTQRGAFSGTISGDESSQCVAVYTSSTGSTGSITITNPTSGRLMTVVRAAWRGGDGWLTTPAPSGTTRTASTTHALPTQDTTAADQLVVGTIAYDSGEGTNFPTTFSMPSPWVERAEVQGSGGFESQSIGLFEVVRTASGTQSGTITASRSVATYVWSATLAAAAPTEVTKTGSDSGSGTEAGGVTADLSGSDAATGAESGHVALDGGDSGTGTEEGYSGEERVGGDTGAGTEVGDSSATSTGGDAGTGAESGDSSATLDPPAETATGADSGHIAIPGSDSAVGTDAHLAPTEVTVSTGETATGAEGGYVETLYGNLILSLYAVDPDIGELIALPDYESLDISRERNDKGAIRIQYPTVGKGFELLRDSVTSNRDLEFELWTNGTPTGALRGYFQEAAGDDVVADDAGEDGSWQFAGSFLEVRTDETIVFPQSRGSQVVDPDSGELVWTNPRREFIVNADSPGEVVSLLLEQAQDRGALLDIERDFTTTHDSNGVPWAGVLTAKFSPGSTYTQILDKLVELHLAEWAIVWDSALQRKVLKLWNAEGRGADLTVGPRPVILRRGRNLLDAPRKWSVRESATTVLAAGAEGVYRDTTDPTALARRDRRVEAYTSLQNATDEDAVLAWAQAQLSVLAPGLLSIEHGIGMLPGEPRPIIAFDIGDWVFSQTGITPERLRVVQWTLRVDINRTLSGTVTLNDTVRDAVERLQERLNAISSGEAVVGTSEPGGSNEPDRTPPAMPEGVVASSIAYQDPEHGPGQTLAMVTVAWLPVTTNADGSDSPLVQAAVYIRDKFEDEAANPEVPDPDQEDGGPNYDPIDPATWTWKNCPQVVRDFADEVRALWVADGSPADRVAWLTAYIAEASQTPTAAEDVAGYDVVYSYLGLEQVGGIPSSDPFPEDERVYYWATPPSGTSATEYSFGNIEGGSRLRIQVRAFDRAGNYGPWATISHDCANDTTPPPVPSAPTGLKTWFRTLDVPWDGLGAEGEPMPIDFSHVRVWVGQGADLTLPAEPVGDPVQFDPAATGPQYVANLYAGGTWNVPDLPIGVGYYARLQAVDRSGNASVGSTVVGPVTAQQLVGQDILDGIIDATKIGPDSIESQHVVNGAITTAKIGDAQILAAKIGLAQINTAHIDEVSAGKITTGTLTATVTVSGSLWTSTDPNVTRLGFSAAGLQLYRARSGGGSDLVGEWRTSDGGMLVTGTYQSSLSGQRIHIDPDGSMRFYPQSGSNYSRIMNEGNDVVFRGPLDANGYSGRINVNMLGPGLNFSREENLLRTITSEFVLFDRRMRSTAPFIEIQVDERRTNPVGGRRRVQFSHVSSSGNAHAFLNYLKTPSGDTAIAAGGGASFVFVNPAAIHVKLAGDDDFTDWVNIHAAGYPGPSSRDVKTDIEDARAILDPLQVIRSARGVKYRYRGDSEIAQIVKFGVIADELPEELILKYSGDPQVYVDYSSLTGVLWAAIGQLQDQQALSVTGSANVPNGNYNAPDEIIVDVLWDEEPLEVPSDVTALALVGMPTAMGKVRCRYVPGSATLAGCQIRVSFKGLTTVTGQLPLVIEAWGRYVWTPPYVPPEEAA